MAMRLDVVLPDILPDLVPELPILEAVGAVLQLHIMQYHGKMSGMTIKDLWDSVYQRISRSRGPSDMAEAGLDLDDLNDDGHCPFCDSPDFIIGSSGGFVVNIKCVAIVHVIPAIRPEPTLHNVVGVEAPSIKGLTRPAMTAPDTPMAVPEKDRGTKRVPV